MSKESAAATSNKPSVAVLDGWFTMDEDKPHLLGSQCNSCGTYYFPKQSNYCKNPSCDGESFNEVPLSRTGKVWSFTNACYQPPEPYIAADPYQPYAIAAVELEKEKMVVLGQVITGVDVDALRAGMQMELVLETLFEDDESRKLTW
ncbi:MAG: OB-fold domain-containing protein, partial [Gammaproteobacteria bacterium]|nr:OB-fold domain-containing protein [Gammaproteobacteria bacterium]